jgi:hypothetical protein
MRADERGQVNIPDVFTSFYLLVGLIALTPVLYTMGSWAADAADPFTGLLIQAFIPLLYLAVIAGVGISARS